MKPRSVDNDRQCCELLLHDAESSNSNWMRLERDKKIREISGEGLCSACKLIQTNEKIILQLLKKITYTFSPVDCLAMNCIYSALSYLTSH